MNRTYTLSPTSCLFHADAREALRILPDNSIDAVPCDPPYNIASIRKRFGASDAAVAQHGRDGAFTRLSERFVGIKWDDDVAFSADFWREVFRVLKPGGHVAAFAFPKTSHRLTTAIEDAGFEIRDSVMWLYGTGQVRRRENLKPGHEPVTLGRKPLSEPTLDANMKRWGVGGLFIDAARGEDDRWPVNVVHTDAVEVPWFFNAKASKADRAGSKHPTVKPIALMQWLCRLITPPGGTVLDPFAGSGTTGAAAALEGFNSILIEREAEYVQDILARFAVGKAA